MQVIQTLLAIFKFWDQVTWLVKKLERTPEDKRQAIIADIQKELEEFKKDGRPSW